MTHLSARDEAELAAFLHDSRSASENLDALFDRFSGYDTTNQQMAVDLCSYLPEQILPMLDRATMASSLEGRVPFVDIALVEYCMSLSSRTKLGMPRLQKRLLRKAIAEWMPSEIVRAKKAGMPSPFPAFVEQRPSVVRQIVLGRDAFAPTLLSREWLERRLGSIEDMKRHAPLLYALVIFEIWHRLFIVERSYDQPKASLSDLFEIPEKTLGVTA
jgi:asparagine synthase (glutamine-hydrolysing)